MNPSWAGDAISYAANALTTGGTVTPTLIGVICPMSQGPGTNPPTKNGWDTTNSKNLAAIGLPATTIFKGGGTMTAEDRKRMAAGIADFYKTHPQYHQSSAEQTPGAPTAPSQNP